MSSSQKQQSNKRKTSGGFVYSHRKSNSIPLNNVSTSAYMSTISKKAIKQLPNLKSKTVVKRIRSNKRKTQKKTFGGSILKMLGF